MHKPSNISSRYGLLTVKRELEPIYTTRYKRRVVLCVCDCGTEKKIRLGDLTSGQTISCGCNRKKKIHDALTTHGMANKTKLYRRWANMRTRVFNTGRSDYKHYGGRGITICERWLSFENFYTDMNDSFQKHEKEFNGDSSLERINVDGNYEPKNCKWIKKGEQAKNTRRSLSYKAPNPPRQSLSMSYRFSYDNP